MKVTFPGCRLALVIAVLLFGEVSLVRAGNIYVKMNGGSDSTGDGSSGSPFKTISFALSQASPDDVIRVKGGTTSASYYTITNGEHFPLEPGPAVEAVS